MRTHQAQTSAMSFFKDVMFGSRFVVVFFKINYQKNTPVEVIINNQTKNSGRVI